MFGSGGGGRIASTAPDHPEAGRKHEGLQFAIHGAQYIGSTGFLAFHIHFDGGTRGDRGVRLGEKSAHREQAKRCQ